MWGLHLRETHTHTCTHTHTHAYTHIGLMRSLLPGSNTTLSHTHTHTHTHTLTHTHTHTHMHPHTHWPHAEPTARLKHYSLCSYLTHLEPAVSTATTTAAHLTGSSHARHHGN